MHCVNKVKSYFNFPRQQFEIVKKINMVQIILINEHNNYE
jgi:hypothetical protein